MGYTLVFWLIVASIGLLLYVYPIISVRTMYEAFENVMPRNTANPSDKSQADLQKLLQSMDKVMEFGTPNFDVNAPVNPSIFNMPSRGIVGNTGKSVPMDSEITKSTPQTAEDAKAAEIHPSVGLEQGKTFQKSLPSIPVLEIVVKNQDSISGSMTPKDRYKAYKDAKRCARTNICPHPKRCPPRRKCPPPIQCPDMSQFIRKDSIPCWGCKLPTK